MTGAPADATQVRFCRRRSPLYVLPKHSGTAALRMLSKRMETICLAGLASESGFVFSSCPPATRKRHVFILGNERAAASRRSCRFRSAIRCRGRRYVSRRLGSPGPRSLTSSGFVFSSPGRIPRRAIHCQNSQPSQRFTFAAHARRATLIAGSAATARNPLAYSGKR